MIILIFVGCQQKAALIIKNDSNVVLTVDDIGENISQYIGKEFIMRGMVEEPQVMCTANVCMKDRPCCQVCGGSLAFVINKSNIIEFQGEYKNELIRCMGTNCKQECYPFELGKNYTVKIILEKSKFNRYFMNLIEIIE